MGSSCRSPNFAMTWDLIVSRSAQKGLRRLPPSDQKRMDAAFEQMTRDPYSGDIAVLKGMRRTLRRRVGDYRIFFDLDSSLRRITVLKIDRRTTTTY